MKKAAWITWALALIFFVDACVEEYTGVAEAASSGRGGGIVSAAKASDPQGFSSIMAYQWIRIALTVGLGGVFLGLHRWLAGFDVFDPESKYDPEAGHRPR